MTCTDDVALLDLHRELCAAIRDADQAFARLYLAERGSTAANQHEQRYRLALAQARKALQALLPGEGGGACGIAAPAVSLVDSARQVC